MNLESEILQLCFDVLEKELTPLEAQKEILRLLDVVEQSKLQAENSELRRQLDEISEIEEKNTPTAYSSGWNDLLDKIDEIINE